MSRQRSGKNNKPRATTLRGVGEAARPYCAGVVVVLLVLLVEELIDVLVDVLMLASVPGII